MNDSVQPSSLSSRGPLLFVAVLWGGMTAAGLWHVGTLGYNVPYADEWEWVEGLTNNRPLLPWLWAQHNEHRLPLARLFSWLLFQLTSDFRSGMYALVLGLSGLSAGLIVAAARIRGRVALSDAFFPLALLHWGHHENLRMGIQTLFLMPLAGGCGLLWLVWQPAGLSVRRAVSIAGLTLAVMMTGAAGLPFGPVMSVWLIGLAFALARSGRVAAGLAVSGLAILPLIYLTCYFYDYSKPAHHPPSAGVFPSLRIAAEAMTMSLGDFSADLRPAWWSVAAILCCAILASGLRASWLAWTHADRWQVCGWLLVLCGGLGIAIGIGWGRSGFGPEMGLWSRYGLLAMLIPISLYFFWLKFGGPEMRAVVPIGLFAVSAMLLGYNMARGYHVNAGLGPGWQGILQEDVRANLPLPQVLDRYFSGYGSDHPHYQAALRALPQMRDFGVGVFRDWRPAEAEP